MEFEYTLVPVTRSQPPGVWRVFYVATIKYQVRFIIVVTIQTGSSRLAPRPKPCRSCMIARSITRMSQRGSRPVVPGSSKYQVARADSYLSL